MTVESNCDITIPTLGVWLSNFAPVFKSVRTKTESNRTFYARFFPRFEPKSQVYVWNSDWFIAQFAPVVTGRSNYFGSRCEYRRVPLSV